MCMLYLLFGIIIGSLLTIAFFLGGVKANKNYSAIIDQLDKAFERQPNETTTFSEPVDMKELFTNAKSPDDLLIKK